MRKSHLKHYGVSQENLDEAQAATTSAEATAAGTSPEVEVVAVDPQPVVTELEPGADGLEAALVALNEGTTEAEENEGAVANASDVIEKLEVATEKLLPVIIQNGGLDRNGAAILSWALEGLYERVGMPSTSRGLAAESFGSVMEKVEATQLSMEEVKNASSEIWTKLVELWEKAIAHIAALWLKFWDTATKLKGRADKVAGTAGTIKGNAKSKTIPAKNFGQLLAMNGKVEPKAVSQVLLNMAKELGASMETTKNEAAKMLEGLTSGKTETLKYALPAGFSAVDPAKVGMPQPEEGMAIYSSGKERPGNKTLVIVAPAEVASATPADLAKTAARMASFDTSRKPNGELQVTVLSPADLAKTAQVLSQVADGLLAYKSIQAEIDKIRKEALAKAKSMISEGNANGALTDMAKACMAIASQFGPITAAYLANAATATIQLVETSMLEYGVENTAAKPAPMPAEKPAEKPAEEKPAE